jgi:hypothetical protein
VNARRTTSSVLALAAALALRVGAPGPAAEAAGASERVVLVILGGGVRAKEMLDRPDLMPTIRKIATAGFSSRGWRTTATDHGPALRAILTGRAPPGAPPPPDAPLPPTFLEAAREGLALEREQVWFVTHAPEDPAGDDPSLSSGDEHAPAVATGEGPFGEPLRPLFDLFGRPTATSPRAFDLLGGLRALSPGPVPPSPAQARESARLEAALLEEVDRRAPVSGPNALDARALRAARTVLRVHRPRLLVVHLGQADVGHTDLFAHWEVLRRNDAGIGLLRETIASDPALSGTALLVTADLGRNAKQNAAGGYDHDDGSDDATTVAVVGEGAGIRRGAILSAPLDVRDLAPTIGRLLGFPTPHAEGRARTEIVSR